MTENNEQQRQSSDDGPSFSILKVYTRDVSFESPAAPEVFREEWKPEINLELGTSAREFDKNLYEVTLSFTVTAKQTDKVAYIAEIHQAGVFQVQGYPEEGLKEILTKSCPNILLPYASEQISNVVTRAGFPQYIPNIFNFNALVNSAANAQEKVNQQAADGKEAGQKAT